MKEISTIFCLVFVFFFGSLNAQQEWNFSQYVFNPYDANIAFAGQYNAIALGLRYRAQWTGFEGAPTSYYMSANSPLANQRLAVGVRILQEEIGARKLGQYSGSLTYRVPLRNARLSGGLSLGYLRWSLDKQALEVKDQTDVDKATNAVGTPTADLAFMWSTENYYIGIQTSRLLSNQKSWIDQNGRASRHFTAIASYAFAISRNWSFRPSMAFKSDRGKENLVELNAMVTYQTRLWLGASYRKGGTASVQTQWTLSQRWRLGYSYDFIVGSTAFPTQMGSHEVFLGFNLATRWFEPSSVRYF